MHTATRIAVRGPAAHQAARPEGAPLRLRALRPHERGAAARTGRGHRAGRGGGAGAAARWPATAGNANGGSRKRNGAAQSEPVISLGRVPFEVPDRSGLPKLSRYAHLVLPDGSTRVAGFAEGSRGCKHLCRHCPVVPVYQGTFRIVPADVVMEDIRAAGQGRGDAHLLRRPGFLQRSHPWPEARAGVARRVSRRHVRCHHQDSAPHRSRQTAARAAALAGACSSPPPWRPWTTTSCAFSTRTIRAATSTGRSRSPAKPALRSPRPSSPSPRGRRWRATSRCCERLLELQLVESVPPVQLIHPAARSRRLVPAEAARLQGAAAGLRSQAPGLSVGPSRSPRGRIAARPAGVGRPMRAAALPRREVFAAVWRMAHEAAAAPRARALRGPRICRSRVCRSRGTAAPSRPTSSCSLSEGADP